MSKGNYPKKPEHDRVRDIIQNYSDGPRLEDVRQVLQWIRGKYILAVDGASPCERRKYPCPAEVEVTEEELLMDFFGISKAKLDEEVDAMIEWHDFPSLAEKEDGDGEDAQRPAADAGA